MSDADVRRLRLGGDERDADGTRDDRPAPPGAPAMVAKTTTVTTYPTAAQAYYACIPQSVLGTEAEGATGLVNDAGGTVFALNLGNAIPPSGTKLVITNVGHRFVFRYDGV